MRMLGSSGGGGGGGLQTRICLSYLDLHLRCTHHDAFLRFQVC